MVWNVRQRRGTQGVVRGGRTTSTVTAVSQGVSVIDLLFQGEERAIAAYLLWDRDEAALVETGPASSLDALLAGLERAGAPRERVTKLLLTHIHLDHAGAAGSLLRLLPNATVHVHPVGAPHLADPAKLVASAARIYGEDMDRLWGETLPVPAGRLRVLQDGELVAAGGRLLRALHTPGHASHHVAYWDEAERSIYAGDVAGVRLPGAPVALPPTPPPDLDVETWSASIERLLALDASTLYLTHFGPAGGVARHLEELRARLHGWRDLVLGAVRGGAGQAVVAGLLERHANEELEAAGTDAETRRRYGLVAGYEMNAAGLVRYLTKRGLLPR